MDFLSCANPFKDQLCQHRRSPRVGLAVWSHVIGFKSLIRKWFHMLEMWPVRCFNQLVSYLIICVPSLDSGGVVEAELVFLLNQLCVALVKDPSVLELFFHTSEDQGAANFLLFSLLIPYTHR